jgi:hypothetical protein
MSLLLSQKATFDGRDRSGDFYVVDLWRKPARNWQIIARYSTPSGRNSIARHSERLTIRCAARRGVEERSCDSSASRRCLASGLTLSSLLRIKPVLAPLAASGRRYIDQRRSDF